MKLNEKTLLITEIGNFVGLRAAEMAIAQGMKVRGLQSSPEQAQAVKDLAIPVVIGSTTETDTLAEACQDIDIVFHTESVIDAGGSIERFRQVNVGGTINIAKAAKNAGVKTFIHLSSVMVYGFKFPDQIGEEGSLRGENNPFCQTKIEAEIELLKYNDPPNFGVIIIRAGDVYGPGALSWIIQPLELMQKKQFFLVDGDRNIFNHVYVDNLIDAVFLAAEKESYGEAFNITDGTQTTWQEFYTRLATIAEQPKPSSMPAFAIKAIAKTVGKQLGVLPETVDFISRSHSYSIAKARHVLGYQPHVDLDEGMMRTAVWLENNNLVKPISV
jgi:nucleoside-diphosphate-sugar epimerase